MPAENEEILILVTDTPDEKCRKSIKKKARRIKIIAIPRHDVWSCGYLNIYPTNKRFSSFAPNNLRKAASGIG